MQSAETALGVLRERGRRGLPCDESHRQTFNFDLYLLAYGKIYANHGAMRPGASAETADGMSEDKIQKIIEATHCKRYRFSPVRRTFSPKKNGKMRPLGLPTDRSYCPSCRNVRVFPVRVGVNAAGNMLPGRRGAATRPGYALFLPICPAARHRHRQLSGNDRRNHARPRTAATTRKPQLRHPLTQPRSFRDE